MSFVCVCLFAQWNITQPSKVEMLLLRKTWMGLEGIMVIEIIQTEKDKYFIISLMCEI